jgi:parallel beta-helix repeat protein
MQSSRGVANNDKSSSRHSRGLDDSVAYQSLFKWLSGNARAQASTATRPAKPLDAEKYHNALVRLLKTSKKKSKKTKRTLDLAGHRIKARSLSILSIVLCTLLVTSAYASTGSIAWAGGLTSAIRDMLSPLGNMGDPHSALAAKVRTTPVTSSGTDVTEKDNNIGDGGRKMNSVIKMKKDHDKNDNNQSDNTATSTETEMSDSSTDYTYKDESDATSTSGTDSPDTTEGSAEDTSSTTSPTPVDSSTSRVSAGAGGSSGSGSGSSATVSKNSTPPPENSDGGASSSSPSAEPNSEPNSIVDDDTDSAPPTITVPSAIIDEASSSSGAIVDYSSEVSAHDAVDGELVAICEPVSGSTFALGKTTVTCLATDASGNTASAAFNITIHDTSAPVLIVPPDITMEAEGVMTSVSIGSPSVSDTVDGSPEITNDAPADGFPVGTTTVTWTATDASGNVATATQLVTITDTTPPSITTPLDIEVEATGPLGAVVGYSGVSATDLVDGTLSPICEPATGSTFSLGVTIVTCEVWDSHDNTESKSFSITVRDTTPPQLVPPPDITVEMTGILTSVVLGSPGVNDTVDALPTITNNAPVDGFPVGTTAVTWLAMDDYGNTATATQLVTVLEVTSPETDSDLGGIDSDSGTNSTLPDTTPPTIIPPADVTVEATGTLTVVELGTPTVSDLEDPSPVVTNDAPADGFPVGTTTVTWTATDASGNVATATQLIMVEDTTPPQIVAPSDIVAEAEGTLTTVPLGTSTASDLADSSPLVTNNAPAEGFPVGNTTVTWLAMDASGNYATANQLVTIINSSTTDEEVVEGYTYLPSFSANGTNYYDITHHSSLSLDRFSLAAWFKTSKDYSADGMIVNKNGVGLETAGSNLNYGLWLDKNEVLKAGFEDSSGANYFVISSSKFNDGHWHYAVVTYNGTEVALFVDNSLIGTLSTTAKPDTGGTNSYPLRIGANSQANERYFEGEIDEVRVWNRALTVNEVANSYHGTITMEGLLVHMNGDGVDIMFDANPPTIIPPADVTVEATGTLTQVQLGTPTVSDLEDPSPIVTNNAPADGFPVGTNTVTWTATDASGNVATAMQKVTVQQKTTGSVTPTTVTYYTIPAIGGVKPTTVTYGSTIHTVCDSGCTHTSIKAAIDGLPSSGGKVILKGSKTHSLSSTISLRSNIVIEFESGSTISFSGSGKVFSGKNVNNVMFVNPVITRSTAEDVLYFSNADTIIVQGGKITGKKGSASSGFECKSCKNVLVQSSTISTFSRPIDVGTTTSTTDGSTRNIWIVRNTVYDSSIECVKINRGYDMHALENTVRDCANNGIDVGFNVGAEAKYNKLTNTGFSSADNAVGFHTDSSNTVVLMENTVDGTGTDGIRVCGSDNNYVIGNKISNTGTTTVHNEGNGISVISCTGGTETVTTAVIDGNHVSYVAKTGVYISAASTDCYITTNTINNYGTNAILDASKKAIISGNTIT